MSLRSGERVAVSLTPASLDADSRAFRIAHSLAEAGYRSVVLEGRPSGCRDWGSDIEVRSAGHSGILASGSAGESSPLQRTIGGLRNGRLGKAGELALYSGFRGYDWWRHRHQPTRLLPEAELYYLHSFELHRVVAPVAARLGASVIYDAHDFSRGIEPVERQPPFDRNHMRPFLNRLEDRLVADAHAVVTVSDGVGELMAGAFGRRPVVIRNCHDDRLDRAAAPDLRTSLGLPSGHRLCVVVGNWKPGMAVGAAVGALARLPEHFHLAFLGRGYDKVARTIPNDLLGRRIHLRRAVAPNQVVPAIRSADIGLVAYEPYSENYRFALPNGFFQVIAAGLPLVRAPLPEIEATIAHHHVGICVERLEPAFLAEAIARCAEEAETFGANAAALAHELRWEAEASRLHQLLDGMGANPAGLAPASPADRIPMLSEYGS